VPTVLLAALRHPSAAPRSKCHLARTNAMWSIA
jgi:hypothetical protein